VSATGSLNLVASDSFIADSAVGGIGGAGGFPLAPYVGAAGGAGGNAEVGEGTVTGSSGQSGPGPAGGAGGAPGQPGGPAGQEPNSNGLEDPGGGGTAFANVGGPGTITGPSPPDLTGGLATVPAGTYGPGEQMELLLKFNEAVAVTGDTVTLSLNDGGTAILDVANTAALDQYGLVAFDYTVADNAQDVAALTVTAISNGSTIGDSAGNAAQYPALPTFSGVAIDPAAPSQNNVPCYCRGTLILTTNGEVKVEDLREGCHVFTASGAARPIKWIGRRSYGGRFVIGREDILPICLKAGALDDNVPKRDLWISPHHAMYLEGVLIEARDLVNGVSVVQAERVDKVEYFHIELDSHDVIIAEGSLSESFIDDDSRGMFHNAHEYREIYGDAPPALAHYCAPRCSHGYAVEAARLKIEQRAGMRTVIADRKLPLRGHVDLVHRHVISGWAQNPDHREAPVCLGIYAGGQLIGRTLANRYRSDLERAGLGSGRRGFVFKPPAGLDFAADTVQVLRSLDGAGVKFSAASRRASQQLAVV
jgi:Hint domain